jgi:RNA-binding protein Tab2/Atab2
MTTIWELDFYSRPIVDENQKKVWEVLICESPTEIDADSSNLFYYAEYCSNSQVNSAHLSELILKAVKKAGITPDRIRFFRQSMNNMITKACSDAGIPCQPSRRTYLLNQWLKERMVSFYPKEPGYQSGGNATVTFPLTPPQPLQDALRAQKWGTVALEAGALSEMNEWSIDFGEAYPIADLNLKPDTLVPGLILYSQRALAIAAWMSGLELAAVRYDTQDGQQLVLETGVIDRWSLAQLLTMPLQAEARQFEDRKIAANGVHFLAIQKSPEDESFAGFWLLLDI